MQFKTAAILVHFNTHGFILRAEAVEIDPYYMGRAVKYTECDIPQAFVYLRPETGIVQASGLVGTLARSWHEWGN